jgi:geranylgeranyl reductase family protein
MAPEARDVVVVGGGPAGSAAAIFLRERGHDVLVLDEARFPRDKVCGEGVSPEAWRLLRAMGAADEVRALHPHPLRGMELTSPDGTRFRGLYRAEDAGFAVRRRELDACLLTVARRAGAEVREGVRVAKVLHRDGLVRAVVASTDSGDVTIDARFVVAADGRRSIVARQLGLLREHRRLRKYAVRGYWSDVAGLGEHGEMHVGGGGYCGIAPLGPRDANVAFVVDRAEMQPAGGDLEAFYRGTLQRWPRIAERLARATLTEPPRAIGPLALEARRVSVPGAALVGDAAGFYDPFTGEGITLALRGAEILAEVADGWLRGAMDLREYDRRRRAATRDKFRLNRLLQRVVAWPAVANGVARRLARRQDLADRLVGIAGDFVPARSALGAGFVWDLLSTRPA